MSATCLAREYRTIARARTNAVWMEKCLIMLALTLTLTLVLASTIFAPGGSGRPVPGGCAGFRAGRGRGSPRPGPRRLWQSRRMSADQDVDQGYDPRTGEPAGEAVPHTTAPELERACHAAAGAAAPLAAMPPPARAGLLRAVGAALAAHGDELVGLAEAETALGTDRLSSELTRTRVQLEMFAGVLEEGSHLAVIIDLPDPAAQPAPRPDLRRMLVPTGPVAVYAASNFPFAFSVAGGDTASALAAGCPVIVKAHPGHPGLSARCGRLVAEAVAAAGAPEGTFAVVHGMAAGRALVRHPAITAAGFTGSLTGGRALYDLACARPDPIPFYGELGALNPVVVTAGALAVRADEIVAGFVASYTLGSGQFCTKPGVVLLPAGHGLEPALAAAAARARVGPLLNERVRTGYEQTAAGLAAVPGVESLLGARANGAEPGWSAWPQLFRVDVPSLVARPDELLTECFGPASLLVEYASDEELFAALDALPGSLTGTLHADLDREEELAAAVVERLTTRAGRVVFGGWPTGVAVTWAMQHGGPWPATTHAGHTSVGVTAMRRFQRPVVYQNTPDPLLPPALREGNPWRVPRRVNGAPVPG
jgi:acyl-CoA reductase-like NAD-dependent aldehyde dehydrogenase